MIARTPEEIEILREGGRRLAQHVRVLCEMVKPGVASADIETKAREMVAHDGDDSAANKLGPERFIFRAPARPTRLEMAAEKHGHVLQQQPAVFAARDLERDENRIQTRRGQNFVHLRTHARNQTPDGRALRVMNIDVRDKRRESLLVA